MHQNIALTAMRNAANHRYDICFKHLLLLPSPQRAVGLLLRRGAEANARDKFWQTPLHVAAANRATRCAEALLTQLSNLNMADRTGRTALHHAAQSGFQEVRQGTIAHLFFLSLPVFFFRFLKWWLLFHVSHRWWSCCWTKGPTWVPSIRGRDSLSIVLLTWVSEFHSLASAAQHKFPLSDSSKSSYCSQQVLLKQKAITWRSPCVTVCGRKTPQ